MPPRIFSECKILLQLSPDKRVGDWYLFENHTEIRVYGIELQPFLLPRFLTPRIFSLEFIRQRLNFDYVHFVSRKYKSSFKLKKEVGPFVVNTRTTLQVTENLLQDMGFQQGKIWIYDPHSIISTKRTGNGLTPYQHKQKS
jgi:hypothetical protein